MTDQTINESTHPEQSIVSPVVQTILDSRAAYAKYQDDLKEWKDQANLAEKLQKDTPPKPSMSETARAGEKYWDIFNKAEGDVRNATSKDIDRKPGVTSQRNIERRIHQVENGAKDSAEHLAEVAGLATQLARHTHEEVWKDLVSLLSLRPDVLQLETQLPTNFVDKISLCLHNNSTLLQNKEVRVLLKLVLESGNLNEKNRGKATYWLAEGVGAAGLTALVENGSRGEVEYNSFSSKSLEHALELTPDQADELVKGEVGNKLLFDNVPVKMAQLVNGLPEGEERFEMAAKVIGVLKAYFNLGSSTGGSYANNRRYDMYRVAVKSLISLCHKDESVIEIIKTEENNPWPKPLIDGINYLANMASRGRSGGYHKELSDQHDDLRERREKIKDKEIKEKQAAEEERRKQEEEAEEKLKEEERKTRQELFSRESQKPQFVEVLDALSNVAPGKAEAVREQIEKLKIEGKLSPEVIDLLGKVVDAYGRMQTLLSERQQEVVDRGGLFGLGKKTHMETVYELKPEEMERISQQIKDGVEEARLPDMATKTALEVLAKFAKRRFSN